MTTREPPSGNVDTDRTVMISNLTFLKLSKILKLNLIL